MQRPFVFGQSSRERLMGVHPDLIRVANRALEISEYDFGINEGVRTVETQEEYYASGVSKTMNSLHLMQADDYAHAIDILVYVPGIGATYEHKYFRKVMQAFVTAAIELGVQLRFGGLWRDFVDSPHIELNGMYYRGDV